MWLFTYVYIHTYIIFGWRVDRKILWGGDGQIQWGTEKFYKGGRTHTIIYTDTNNIQYSWGGTDKQSVQSTSKSVHIQTHRQTLGLFSIDV